MLFVCLCVPLMGKIFNGFGYVTNRWCYGFAFCMALIVVCLLPRLVELRAWEQVALAVLTGGYIAAVVLLERSRGDVEWGAMALLALVTGAVILASHWKNKAVGQGLVAVITVAAILFNLSQFYDPAHSDALERYVPAGDVKKAVSASAEQVAANLEGDGSIGPRWRPTGAIGSASPAAMGPSAIGASSTATWWTITWILT